MYDYYTTTATTIQTYSIIALILTIVLDFFAARKMCDVAELKGHDAKNLHIFAWCFWFPIFGYLYVIALPDLNLQKQNEEIVNLLQNSDILSKYVHQKSEQEEYDSWTCPKCGLKNPKTRMTCQKCDTYKNAHL